MGRSALSRLSALLRRRVAAPPDVPASGGWSSQPATITRHASARLSPPRRERHIPGEARQRCRAAARAPQPAVSAACRSVVRSVSGLSSPGGGGVGRPGTAGRPPACPLGALVRPPPSGVQTAAGARDVSLTLERQNVTGWLRGESPCRLLRVGDTGRVGSRCSGKDQG